MWRVLCLALGSYVFALGSAQCINVDAGPHGAPPGENTCFATDAVGAVCGWDGTPDQAYCTLDRGATKVCARWSAGGRCPRGHRPPATKLTAKDAAAKAALEARHAEAAQDAFGEKEGTVVVLHDDAARAGFSAAASASAPAAHTTAASATNASTAPTVTAGAAWPPPPSKQDAAGAMRVMKALLPKFTARSSADTAGRLAHASRWAAVRQARPVPTGLLPKSKAAKAGPIVLVINLPRRADRRAEFRMRWAARVPQIPLDHITFFPAVEPRPCNAKKCAASELWLDKTHQPPAHELFETRGSYGCYLSHLIALAFAARLHPGSDIIVFEDDTVWSQHFVLKLAEFLGAVPPAGELLYLGGTMWSHPFANVTLPPRAGYTLGRRGYMEMKMMGNTASYIVPAKHVPVITRKLREYPYRKNVDIQLSEMCETHKILSYCPQTALCGQARGWSDASKGENKNQDSQAVAEKRSQNPDHWSIAGGFWNKDGLFCALCKSEPCAWCASNGVDWRRRLITNRGSSAGDFALLASGSDK